MRQSGSSTTWRAQPRTTKWRGTRPELQATGRQVSTGGTIFSRKSGVGTAKKPQAHFFFLGAFLFLPVTALVVALAAEAIPLPAEFSMALTRPATVFFLREPFFEPPELDFFALFFFAMRWLRGNEET
jgi:hypothetical protein